MAEKKNPDYAESAENLVNPVEVKDLLDQLHLEEQAMEDLKKQLEEQSSELCKAIVEMGAVIADTQKQIKQAIEAYGSYQDTDAGVYAVKYRRGYISYDVQQFIEFFPDFVPVVVKSVVNEDALEGLIKGGLIKIEELRNVDVIKEEFKYAFYIR